MSTIHLFTVLALFFGVVHGYGVVIRSGLGQRHTSTLQNGEETGGFQTHNKMQLANFEADDGFNRADEKHHAAATDTGAFHAADKDVSAHKDVADYADKTFKQEDGENVHNEDNKKEHKKGHQKSGFHNTYHKDESGSQSSYFDEASDAGDQYNRNAAKGVFGDNATRNQHGYRLADKANSSDQRRHGQFDAGDEYVKNHGAGGEYARKQYEDGGKAHGNRAAANAYGEGGNTVRDEIVHKPHVHHHQQYWPMAYRQQPPPPPPPPMAYDGRITIYEDPGYVRHNRDYRDYDRYYERPRPAYFDERRHPAAADYDYYY